MAVRSDPSRVTGKDSDDTQECAHDGDFGIFTGDHPFQWSGDAGLDEHRIDRATMIGDDDIARAGKECGPFAGDT